MIEPNPQAHDTRTPDRAGERTGPLRLELAIRDPELIRELVAQGEGDARRRYAVQALRIGLLALKNARGDVDVERVRNEGTRLLDNLRQRLDAHQESVHDRIEGKLKEYFDPSNGRFAERVERLVQDGGELERLMRRLVGAEDSELRKTLQGHFGEGSPLMKMLSPSESEGLLQALGGRLDDELKRQRETILREFTLDNQEGALARLVRELKEQHGNLSGDLQERVAGVVREFDLNEDDSALSKLVRRVETAQRQISDEFSLDRSESALARMRSELMDVLVAHRQEDAAFREAVMERLGERKGAAEEARKGTQHGLTFEGALFHAVQARAQAQGDVAQATGNTTGLIRNNKKGDVVVEFGPDSAAAGAKIVVEAKQQASYTLPQAREELAIAAKNRGAQGGLFVFSRRTAPEGMAAFQRIGRDVFIVWDAEDERTDVILDAGLAVARALVMDLAQARPQSEVDFEAIERAINEIEKQAEKLGAIRKSATTIRNSSDNILEQARIMNDNLGRQVGRLRDQMQDVRDAVN